MSEKLFEISDGIDEDACLAIYDGNLDFYRLVLETFCKEITKSREQLIDAFDKQNAEQYRVIVHGLKGSGGSAGATLLVDLATRSNALIKEGSWDSACKLHGPIIEEMNRLIGLIPERIR